MPDLGPGPIVMEAANIKCGGLSPSHHLRLADVHLPGMQEQYVDHRPGGAPLAVEVDVMFQKLTCDFTLVGWTPDTAALIYAWSTGMQLFNIFGAVRDYNMKERGSSVLHLQANITGRLGRVEQANWARGTLDRCAYSIHGIIKYELLFHGQQLYFWNFFENQLSVAGQ